MDTKDTKDTKAAPDAVDQKDMPGTKPAPDAVDQKDAKGQKATKAARPPVVAFKGIRRLEGRYPSEQPFYRVTGEVDGEPCEAILPIAAYDAAPKPQRYQMAVDALAAAQ